VDHVSGDFQVKEVKLDLARDENVIRRRAGTESKEKNRSFLRDGRLTGRAERTFGAKSHEEEEVATRTERGEGRYE